MAILGHSGAAGEDMIDRLGRDPLTSGLLLLHGLHPLDFETRINKAIEKVRPLLKLHGGDVELLGIDDGVIRLALQGNCHGCPSSALTLRSTIEEALYEAAPDLTRLEVSGVSEPLSGGFVPLDRLQIVGGAGVSCGANGMAN